MGGILTKVSKEFTKIVEQLTNITDKMCYSSKEKLETRSAASVLNSHNIQLIYISYKRFWNSIVEKVNITQNNWKCLNHTRYMYAKIETLQVFKKESHLSVRLLPLVLKKVK